MKRKTGRHRKNPVRLGFPGQVASSLDGLALGKKQNEPGPGRGPVEKELAVVGPGYAARNAEAQPRSPADGFGGEKGLQNFVGDLRRDAGAGIGDGKLDAVGTFPERDFHPALNLTY